MTLSFFPVSDFDSFALIHFSSNKFLIFRQLQPEFKVNLNLKLGQSYLFIIVF